MPSCISNNAVGSVAGTVDRRAFLNMAAGGIGLLSLAHLLNADRPALAAARQGQNHAARARAVICLFQHGGPSHLDLFDPKPALQTWHGKPSPQGELEAHFSKERGNVLASPFAFRKHGECGMELSELLPYTGQVADELTLIRSMTTEAIDHEFALRLMHTGRMQSGSPSWGSWVTYALGTESQQLPAYLVLSDPAGLPTEGSRNWSAGWLPASYQGLAMRTADSSPVVNLQPPDGVTPAARTNQLRFLSELNRRQQARYPLESDLSVRIENYELAARMQLSVPEAVDLSGETLATQTLYGLDREETREYGTRCLLARRLVERGVRFVQIMLNQQPWDTHTENVAGHRRLATMTDQPAAALIADLKQRGLLDSTIVIWGGEFGRLPISQGTDGRDHNRHGFSLWVAGGGFRAGYVHGATDDFGYRAVQDPVTVHDLHATLLEALGLDHERLWKQHEGRPTSLTDASVTGARVVSSLLR